MFRYLALVWDSMDADRQATAHQLVRRLQSSGPPWSTGFDYPGMRVFVAHGNDPALRRYELPGKLGVVLGAVFRRLDGSHELDDSDVAFDERTAHRVVESQGRRLITHFWGNYVAFLVEPATGTRSVVKDPTGSLPCYATSYSGVSIIFSSIADCVALNVPLSVNEKYLRRRMVAFEADSGDEPLNELMQVRRGQTLRIGARNSLKQASIHTNWHPSTFTERFEEYEDPGDAARAMHSATRACIRAWARGHETVLHRLSGGLDSSIVGGCLVSAASRQRVVSYTYHNPRGRSDERIWARLAATHMRCEHFEFPLDPSQCNLERLLRMGPTVSPVWGLQYLERTPLELQLARECQATAVFTGEGGDSGFCSESRGHALTDYLSKRGLGFKALGIAASIARHSELTTWKVLGRSMRQWLLGYSAGDHQVGATEACQLVSPEVRGTPCEQGVHPWFENATNISRSTVLRLGTLLEAPEFYDPSVNELEPLPTTLSPLYSQPLIELLLQIPVYVHFYDGRDRGLARLAFQEEVPLEIRRRQWKDRAPGFFDELVLRNADFIRETLLDGVLMKAGLLDRSAVEEALSPKQSRSAFLPGEILKHLDTEAWLRHWSAQGSANRADSAFRGERIAYG